MKLPDPPKSEERNWGPLLGILTAVVLIVAVLTSVRVVTGVGRDEPPSPTPPVTLPTETPYTSPVFVPYESLSLEDASFVTGVLREVQFLVREGDVAGADEVLATHREAESRGCRWGAVAEGYAVSVPEEYERARQIVRGRIGAVGEVTLSTSFEANTTPVIEHVYRKGRVVHDVTLRRLLVVLFVVCERVPPVGIEGGSG